MKILFVYPGIATIGYNAGYSESNNPDTWFIPMGISYLAAVMKREGHEVDVLDFRYETGFSRIQEKIKASDADIVAISFQTPSANYAYQAAKFAKQIKKIVIGGGIHPTVMPQEVIGTGSFDHIIVGEGVISFPKLVRNIEAGVATEKIISGEVEKNLDSLPYPHIFKIYEKHVVKKRKLILMFTSRGCPGRCTFCQPVADKMFGRKLHFRTPENILSEVVFWKKKYNIKQFMIVDDIFTIKKKNVLEFCQRLIEMDLDVVWSINSRVDTFDEDMAKALSESKCTWNCIGFESGSQRILNYLKKKTTVEKGIKTAGLCKKYNINFTANILVGIPTETEEDYKLNFKFISEIKPTIVSYNYMVPYPGTILYDECIRKGWISKNIPPERYEMNANRKDGLISCVNYELAEAWEHPTVHWDKINSDMNSVETLVVALTAERRGYFDLAIEKYKQFVNLHPDSINGHFYLGSLFKRQNEVDDAMIYFKKVIRLGKNNKHEYYVGASYFHMGMIRKKTGRMDKAKSDFQNCLKIIPDHKKAKEELEFVSG